MEQVVCTFWGKKIHQLFWRNWRRFRVQQHSHHKYLVWRAHTLPTAIPITCTELFITYPEMEMFAHTKLPIVSGHLVPSLETIYIMLYNAFYNVAHLHLTFSSDRFKCLMLFTNLHFSSTTQGSCITVTHCSSCWCIVSGAYFSSVFNCFCVLTKTFCVLRSASWLLYFFVIPPSPPGCRRCVQAKHVEKWIYKTTEIPKHVHRHAFLQLFFFCLFYLTLIRCILLLFYYMWNFFN